MSLRCNLNFYLGKKRIQSHTLYYHFTKKKAKSKSESRSFSPLMVFSDEITECFGGKLQENGGAR